MILHLDFVISLLYLIDFVISLLYLKKCRYEIDSVDNIKARE